MKYLLIYLAAAFTITILSCNNKKEKSPSIVPLQKQENQINKDQFIAEKGPIINIIDSVEIKRLVLCLKDSAANREIMREKLSNIFKVKLQDAIKLGKITVTGEPIVWYKSNKAPFFFEAGIPVNKAPAKLSKGLFMSNTGGDSALVAHFFGPAELSFIGYETLTDVLAENKKNKTGNSYEIYIDNKFLPANENIDPYELQTDIVMPYKKRKEKTEYRKPEADKGQQKAALK